MVRRSSRLFVIEQLLANGVLKAYHLAKTSPFANSTVYYVLEKLEREGCVVFSDGFYLPTFKCALEYYQIAGCGEVLLTYFKRLLGEYADIVTREDVCNLLCFLAKSGASGRSVVSAVIDAIGGSLSDISKIPKDVAKIFAATIAASSNYLDDVHKGVIIGDVFIGYCKICGLTLAPCPRIR